MLLDTKIPVKYLLRKVRFELPIVIVYVILLQVFERQLNLGHFAIPVSIPAMLGTAITLVLTFRVNQSYDRWWEARKIWGAIVNDSRTLTRQILTFPGQQDGDTGQVQERITLRQIAWCYALGESLRGRPVLKGHTTLLSDSELSEISSQSNIPNILLLNHSRDIDTLHKSGSINDFQQVELDNTISRLCDSMGMSERINNTVFPKQYSLLVEFLVYLFILILPFGLIEHFGWLEGPVVVLLSIPFFLLEKTALMLENPFDDLPTDTPVTTISRTIEENLRQMLGERFTASPNEPSFYIM